MRNQDQGLEDDTDRGRERAGAIPEPSMLSGCGTQCRETGNQTAARRRGNRWVAERSTRRVVAVK